VVEIMIRLVVSVLLACASSASTACDGLFGVHDHQLDPDAIGVTDQDAAGSDLTDATVNGSQDAARTSATLRETIDDVYASGHSDQCLASSTTQAQSYERVFPLSMFALAGPMHVPAVSFVTVEAASANGVTVQVGTYAGTISSGTATLDVNAIAWLATANANVPDDLSSQAITVPITASVDSGNLIASVSSPSYVGVGGTFVVAGTASAQTLPSFWMAPACSTSSPSTHDGRNNANVGTFIIDVVGYSP
jgi:hypothetical protein